MSKHGVGTHWSMLRDCRDRLATRAGMARLGRRGAATLEFALICLLMLSLLIGIVETSRWMLTLEAVRTVAADAVRTVILRGSSNLNAGQPACSNMTGSLSTTNARTQALRSGDVSITLSGCSTNAGLTTVIVTVSYPFTYSIPLVSGTSRLLQERATAVIN